MGFIPNRKKYDEDTDYLSIKFPSRLRDDAQRVALRMSSESETVIDAADVIVASVSFALNKTAASKQSAIALDMLQQIEQERLAAARAGVA